MLKSIIVEPLSNRCVDSIRQNTTEGAVTSLDGVEV